MTGKASLGSYVLVRSDMSVQPPLSLERVDKTLARRQVLSDIGFSCSPGSVTGLLGPNGAGKTTTVTLATGLRRPDRGSVRVFGLDPVTAEARRHFSLIPQEISFPGPVRVGHCLDFVEGQRAPSSYALNRDQLCDELGLIDLLHRSVGGLSGGQRRRLAVAMGLIRVPGPVRCAYLRAPRDRSPGLSLAADSAVE